MKYECPHYWKTTGVIYSFAEFSVESMKRPPQIPFTINSRPKRAYHPHPVRPNFTSLECQRKSLPIFRVRKKLLMEIEKHKTIILIGETGSGKTTQIPQYIHELKMESDGIVGITQPRRVAAITVAQRVAQEMGCGLGDEVGYSVRFEDVTSPQTKVKYVTDGMLLREAMKDETLKSYSFIILDEAHERTIHTDVLFGIVKEAQKKRIASNLKPLKIIIMSATMDVDHFSKYFDDAPIVYIEGRQYPVEVRHTADPQDDYNYTCLVTIFQIHKEAPAKHDILVFLTGQEEIEAMTARVRSIAKDPLCPGPALKVYPLYAALAASKQLEVFQPSTQSTRKVIISTNIAETSVTISGIKFVIDSGMVKQKIHHPTTGLDVLKVHKISQAQAWQRTGRAGRETAGICYRAYTKLDFDSMVKNSVPEILRSNLSSVILQLLVLKINCLNFDFLDKPPKELILEGLEQLKALGAVVIGDDGPQLTSLGKQMALFPLEPRFSKVILSANEFGCLEEVLSVISVLSGESIFVNNLAKRDEAAAAKSKFASSYGDHVTLLNIFRGYKNTPTKQAWCYENFLSSRNLEYATKVRKQLGDICRKCNISVSSCGQDFDALRQCLLTGFFMNIAELQRDKKYITIGTRQTVGIHPSSVLHGSLPQLVMYSELVQTGKCYMRYVTPIDPEWLHRISPMNLKLISLTVD
ncbi:ATP-dependent RNA helicase DHX33 isoform X2 [Rhodnius prolixus]|uniref:ATP-dependent RNA helicase DHX33 isoform X2 n=1 Tax=Rhodnius prolixus TaxID=13249 RepID=UPI003D18EEFA